MALIPLKDYAELHGKAVSSVQQKVRLGGFETAQKLGRDWFIDDRESYVDRRIKTGDYKGWRKGISKKPFV